MTADSLYLHREISKLKEPTFSLVVPCYKDEDVLERCLDSILDQDYKDYEVIVVFDGKSKQAKKFIKKYPSIMFVELRNNAGVCVARNTGLDIARGKYVSFFSSDFKMKAGALRLWKKYFDNNPEYDFIYGGYLFFDEGQFYPSEPFNEKRLDMYNYIDGGFPIKRSKCPKWDINLKSLNDWDFWLQVVKAGGKGLFIPDYTYIAELPKPGGLSHDSTENWKERVTYIWNKHNIKKSDINVVSFGAIFHAEKLADKYGWHCNILSHKKNYGYKHIHILGFYNSSLPIIEQMIAVNPDTTFSLHFIGSDVEEIYKNATPDKLKEMHDMFFSKMKFMWSEYKETHDKLATAGIQTDIVPLPVDKPNVPDMKDMRIPESIRDKNDRKNYTVAIYQPNAEPMKYMRPMMTELVIALPMIDFIFFGDNRITEPIVVENITSMGWVPIEEVIQQSDCLVRITPADGLPIAPIEFLLCDKDVICNHKVRGAYYIPSETIRSIEEHDIVLNECIDTIISLAEGKQLSKTTFKNIYDKDTFKAKFMGGISE